MTNNRTATGNPTRSFASRVTTLGLALLPAILLLAAFPVSASAAPVGPAVRTAPYHGSVASPLDRFQLANCAAQTVAPPGWNSTTGLLSEAARANASSCISSAGLIGNPGYSYVQMEEQLYLPITTPTNGSHTFEVNWSVKARTALSMRNGTCQENGSSGSYYCDNTAQWSLSGGAALLDLTTGGTYQFAGTWTTSASWENETYEFQGHYSNLSVFSHSGSPGAHSLAWSAKVTSTDRYVIYVYVTMIDEAGIEASQATFTGASCSAMVGMNSAPLGARLVSVSIR